MKNKALLPALLICAISLATAWAIRGQFGHEQGAAWAGGIGALSIVLISGRKDWYTRAFHLALASAAGWGAGGMASYGIVVGYGRAVDFVNAYYGLGMLFVIGGLFGVLGGGLFGVMLSDTNEKPVKWPSLLVEMAVGGIIFYHLLIDEFGWLMTPPRNETWAACLGMAVALFWYMLRNQYQSAIRVAIFAGLGGGFGFAFGNFLQVLGSVSEIKFNFWNVMEYSIGFFGGLGMAYGTFTSAWPDNPASIKSSKILAPLLLIILVIPFFVWDQSFETERLNNILIGINPGMDIIGMTKNIQWAAFLLVILSACYWTYYFYFNKSEIELGYKDLFKFFMGHFGLYTALSLLITGAFISLYRPEQYLYIVNLIIVGLFIGKFQPSFSNRGLNTGRWAINFFFILAVIALLAVVAMSSHGPLNGAHNRFE